MPQATKALTAGQFLLTTLVVQVAIVAALSTMLVRFPWFRRILLTEKRDWPERLIFAASLGVPLTAGVVSRLLINYDAADLTLSGAFLAGLLAGPYAGAIVGGVLGIPPLFARCIDDWDAGTHMTKKEWSAACQRLLIERGDYKDRQ